MSEWQPISSAPKDGRVIWVSDPDCGSFIMSWDRTGTNEFFAPGDVGIWVALDGSFTWRDGVENGGPTAWKPFIAEVQ